MDPDIKQSLCTIGQCRRFYNSKYADGKIEICEWVEIMS